MNAEHKQFLIDHLSGMDHAALAEKHHLSIQSVASRIRWAKEKKEFEGLTALIEEGRGDEENLGEEDIAGLSELPSSSPVLPEHKAPENLQRKNDKTVEDISKLISSVEGRNIARQEAGISKKRIKEHEAKKGRPDPVFRTAMENRRRWETWRRLGISVMDIRKMRGIC